jgi:hypothetical protein
MNLPPGLEPVRDHIQEIHPNKWQEITIFDDMSATAKAASVRLNSLGSLFYFSKVVLGHSRLSPQLHGYMCRELERDTLRLVMEIPRDHFKTTVASVSAPMWWALPFSSEDEDLMSSLGYSVEWIRWMKRAHYSSTRTLIASEVIGNARKIGSKISLHYESNAVFRFLFPSIIPKDSNRWNQDSMSHNRMDGVYHGEGTYDVIGVKGALQSRHYDRIVEDDLVGEKAILSDNVMESTIEWHKKLPGAFDSDPSRPGALGDQLVIGNRWSHRDLNSWIRKNEIGYEFHTHAADGGCCDLHPLGVPIFPEEFTTEKLAIIRATEGAYNFSCQFRNRPVAPEAVRFKESWLRYYSIDVWKEPVSSTEISNEDAKRIANWQQLTEENRMWAMGLEEDRVEAMGATPQRLKKAIVHEVQDGETIPDTRAGELDRIALMDPNHSGEYGRSRNAILVIGIYNQPPAQRRIYLLDCWAETSSHEKWIDAALSTTPGHRGLVVKWRCHALYIESEVAGQQGWKHFIRERMKSMGMDGNFSVRGLKTERSENGKHRRIIGMESIYEGGFFWVRRRGVEPFIEEFSEYPNGASMDLLDLAGYFPQAWQPGSRATARDFMQQEMAKRRTAILSVGPAGY